MIDVSKIGVGDNARRPRPPDPGLPPSVTSTVTPPVPGVALTQPAQTTFGIPQDPGTYLWGGWNKDYGINPAESWYRNPNWGDHVIFNQQYGYQDYGPVAQLYKGGTAFDQFGLTPQGTGNWLQYYPGRQVSTHEEKEAMHQGWDRNSGVSAADWLNKQGNLGSVAYNPYPPEAPIGGPRGTPAPAPPSDTPPSWLMDLLAQFGSDYGTLGAARGGFPTTTPQISLPSEWGTASSVMSDFATGLPTGIPPSWYQGMWDVDKMAASGMPTGVPGAWTQGMQNAATMAGTGAPTAMPGIWNQGMSDVNAMAATGAPTDVSGIYGSWLPVAQQQMKDFSQSEAERLGLEGMRWSTPLQNRVSDYARQMSEQFGLNISQQQVQAEEAARARQLQAMPLQYQYGAGEAGLTEAAKARQMQAIPMQYQFGQGISDIDEAARARQMQAMPLQYQYGAGTAGLAESAKDRGLAGAQGLAGLGQAMTQYPMDLAQLSMNMGLQGQQAQQAEYDKMYNEFLRTSEEGSPWLQNAMALLGIGGGAYTPEMYQESGLGQGLGAGVSIASILAMLKYAGIFGASSRAYKTDIQEVGNGDEELMAEQMLDTKIFKYRYNEESPDKRHLGLIIEEAPSEVSFFDKFVGLYEYIGTLHATIKSLNRRLEKIEGGM